MRSKRTEREACLRVPAAKNDTAKLAKNGIFCRAGPRKWEEISRRGGANHEIVRANPLETIEGVLAALRLHGPPGHFRVFAWEGGGVM